MRRTTNNILENNCFGPGKPEKNKEMSFWPMRNRSDKGIWKSVAKGKGVEIGLNSVT